MSLFNITRIIQNQRGEPLPFLKAINFLEQSSVSANVQSESLALNCVKYLPLSDYKSYIKSDWIFGENYESLVGKALKEGKYDFVEELMSVSLEHLKTTKPKTEQNSQEYYNYLNQWGSLVISPVLNLYKNLKFLGEKNLKSTDYDNYYHLFQVGLSHFTYYYNQRIEGSDLSKIDVNIGNWLEHYKKAEVLFSEYVSQPELIEKIISESHAYPIYMDIYQQGIEFTKEDFTHAVKMGNSKVAIHLASQLALSEKDVTMVLKKVWGQWLSREQAKFSTFVPASLGDNAQYLKSILEIEECLVPGMGNWSQLSHLLIAKPLVAKTIEKYPELKTERLYKGFTASEWTYMSTSFTKFLEVNGLTINTKDDFTESSYEMFFAKAIKNHIGAVSPISPERLPVLHNFVAKEFLAHIEDLSATQQNSSYFAYNLENTLPTKTSGISKKKI